MIFESTEYRDHKGVWHPKMTRVHNILEFIGMESITPIVARDQVFAHMEKFLPADVLTIISSRVDEDGLCDTVFFQILCVLTGFLYAGTSSSRRCWCVILNRDASLPTLLRKGTKKKILVASRVAETGKLYLAALVRWYFHQSQEERKVWLKRFVEKRSLEGFNIKLVQACYQLDESLHRRLYYLVNCVTQNELDNFQAENGIFGVFGTQYLQLLRERLSSIPFVPLDEYVFSS